MPVPDIQECIRLMELYGMLPNIRHHSLVVARVTDILVEDLQQHPGSRNPPGRQLCISAALLHDIAKTPCLDGSCEHARAGAEICRKHGYPEIAEIVEQHVLLKNHDPERYRGGGFTAVEIVYYADKRVRHDEIVSLDERLSYILDRYGKNDQELHKLIRVNFNRCVQLEKYLYNFLHFSPEQLADRVLHKKTPHELL